MNLETALTGAAEAARNRCRMQYYNETGRDPDTVERPVLLGYCFENARELSYELFQRQIPHHIAYGGILNDFVMNVPTIEARDALQEIDETDYYLDEGGIDPAIWEEVPKPEARVDIPDEVNHYWVEVDAEETRFDARGLWHAEIAAEARPHYDEVFVADGHPAEHYIRTEDCRVEPWTRHDDWEWHPEEVEWIR